MDDGAPMGPKKRVRREPAPTTPHPLEIAMEAEADDIAPDSPARRLLIDQGRLVRWQIAKERSAFAARSLLALVGLAAAVLVAAMVWRAATADGLVIQAIEAPADLQAQGFTGRALAAQLQDKLSRMQGETHTPGRAANLRDGAARNIRIEIPNTGVSLDEVDRLLRSWLGRETTVTGEIAEPRSGPDAQALMLTVRLDGAPGWRVVTRTGDLDALLAAGAEKIYEVHAFEGYLRWLMGGPRRLEALPIARAHADTGPDSESAAALYAIAWVDLDLDNAARLDLFRRAILADPRYCAARIDLAAREASAGHSRASLSGVAAAIACSEHDRSLSAEGRTFQIAVSNMGSAVTSGDAAGAVAATCALYKVAPCTPEAVRIKTSSNANGLLVDPGFKRRLSSIAGTLAFAHAPGEAQRLADLPRINLTPSLQQSWVESEAWIALERNDWQGLLGRIEALDGFATLVPGSVSPTSPANWRALALAKLGRRDEASASAAAAPPLADCYPCLYVRGETAAALGDPLGAERWFAEAARQGPSIPIAYERWARTRLARGDVVGAIEKGKRAVALGPGNVDALEALGEAQLAYGDKGAAATFAKAADITPWWGRLHLKWGEALQKLGKVDEAQAKWRAAVALDLSAADRARLPALISGRPA